MLTDENQIGSGLGRLVVGSRRLAIAADRSLRGKLVGQHASGVHRSAPGSGQECARSRAGSFARPAAADRHDDDLDGHRGSATDPERRSRVGVARRDRLGDLRRPWSCRNRHAVPDARGHVLIAGLAKPRAEAADDFAQQQAG
jgi:hypothetical protein